MICNYLPSYLFSFLFLPNTFIHVSSTVSHDDIVESNDPHISVLHVSFYGCSKQHNIRQLNAIRVQPCSQARSSLDSTRASTNVFVSAKSKRNEAWTCEAYLQSEKVVCAQSEYKHQPNDKMTTVKT